MEKFKSYLYLLGFAAILIPLDQITKELVRQNLAYMEIYRPDFWLSNYARILHWRNTGAAFGMFEGGNYLFMALSTLVSLAILYYFPQIPKAEWSLRLAMSLLFCGAVGNLIDRFRFGYVTDFISIGAFPVFNVADSCISLGVATLVVGMAAQEWENRRQKAPVDDELSEASVEESATGEVAPVPAPVEEAPRE